MLTKVKLEAILGHKNGTDEWFALLDSILPKHNINTDVRIAAFISQCAHESANFMTLRENLNYSADALPKIFHKYFPTPESAAPFHRRPEMIANKIYANRMGNGDEASEDGFKYRGRGLVQITGKSNYTAFSNAQFGDASILDNPDYLLSKEGAIESACWFFDINHLNAIADTGDVEAMTRKINGGLNGIDDRKAKYALAIKILGDDNV